MLKVNEAEREMAQLEGRYNDIKKNEERIKQKMTEYSQKIKEGKNKHKYVLCMIILFWFHLDVSS